MELKKRGINMINHKKIYEHIDIINPINYFKKIEKIADKTKCIKF